MTFSSKGIFPITQNKFNSYLSFYIVITCIQLLLVIMVRTVSNGKKASEKEKQSSKTNTSKNSPQQNESKETPNQMEETRNDEETVTGSSKVWVLQNGDNHLKVSSEEEALAKMREFMTSGELSGNFSMKMFDDENKASEYLTSINKSEVINNNNKDTPTIEDSSSKKRSLFDELPDMNFDPPSSSPSKKQSVNGTHGNNENIEDDLIKMMKADIKKRGMKIVVHYFTTVPASARFQPLVIEFQDELQSFNHWLHRCEKWEQVIKYIHRKKKDTGILNKFHYCLKGTKARDPNGDDKYERRLSKNNRITLYREMFVGYVRSGCSKEEIIEAMSSGFKPLINNTLFRECYQLEYCQRSRNQNARILLAANGESTPEGNNYWAMIDGALDNNIELVPHTSLAELLLSMDIYHVLTTVFGDVVTQHDIVTKNLNAQLRKFVFNE